MKKERRNPFGGWCNGNKVRSTQWLTHRQKFSPHQGQWKFWTIFRDLAHWILIFRWWIPWFPCRRFSWGRGQDWRCRHERPNGISSLGSPDIHAVALAVNSANMEKTTERGKREWLVYPVTPTTPIIYIYMNTYIYMYMILVWIYINDKHLNKWIIYIIYIHT